LSHLWVTKKNKRKREESKREADTLGRQIDYIANKALGVFRRHRL